MPIDRGTIRVKAFAVILDEAGAHHAVARMSTTEHPVFHRPLGGSVEVGEYSVQAVVREIQEELGATFVSPELLGVMENVFAINGEIGHEIVFVYGGHLTDDSVVPPDGREFFDLDDRGWVEWRSVSDPPDIPLFPEGLQEMIDDWVTRR